MKIQWTLKFVDDSNNELFWDEFNHFLVNHWPLIMLPVVSRLVLSLYHVKVGRGGPVATQASVTPLPSSVIVRFTGDVDIPRNSVVGRGESWRRGGRIKCSKFGSRDTQFTQSETSIVCLSLEKILKDRAFELFTFHDWNWKWCWIFEERNSFSLDKVTSCFYKL